MPALLALVLTIGVMFLLAFAIERAVLRPLVNQPDIILFMATFGLTYVLIGAGELIFGGNPKQMITDQLYLPRGSTDVDMFGGRVSFQHIDIAAAVIASAMIATLAVFFSKTRIGRALRAVADSHKAALSVGISLNQIWVIVWFTAGIVALVTGIMWGARSDVSFALQVIALKALPVLILGGFTSIPGAIVGGLIIGIGEKLGEFYWGPLVGGGVETWLAYMIALVFLLFRPQGLFGERSLSGFEGAMFYREAGQFKTSYAADMAIFPLRQDRIGLAVIILAALRAPLRRQRLPVNAVLIPFLVFALAAIGLNLLTGYAGLISLGTGGFMGVGAYPATSSSRFSRGERHRLDPCLRILLGRRRRAVRAALLAHQRLLSRGRDAGGAVLPAMVLHPRPLALQL